MNPNAANAQRVAKALRDAEDALADAFAVMGKSGPGSSNLWYGAWGEYQKLGATLCRLRKIRARADAWEQWKAPPKA